MKFRKLNHWWKGRFKEFVNNLDIDSKRNWGILEDTTEIIDFIYSQTESIQIISTRNKEIICFGQLVPTSKTVGEIEGIIVRIDLQRKGIGTQLMNYLENIARENGLIKLRLEVFKSNKKAISFYKKLGYSICYTNSLSKTTYLHMVKKLDKLESKSKKIR